MNPADHPGGDIVKMAELAQESIVAVTCRNAWDSENNIALTSGKNGKHQGQAHVGEGLAPPCNLWSAEVQLGAVPEHTVAREDTLEVQNQLISCTIGAHD